MRRTTPGDAGAPPPLVGRPAAAATGRRPRPPLPSALPGLDGARTDRGGAARRVGRRPGAPARRRRCCATCRPAPSTSRSTAARRAGPVAPPRLAGRGQGRSTRRSRPRWPVASVRRWEAAMDGAGRDAARPCSGASCAWAVRRTSCWAPRPTRSLRLRIATPWDWRQHFSLDRPRHGGPAGRPAPGGLGGRRARPGHPRGARAWSGTSRCAGATAASAGSPEAKGYLDTPHHLVPGYFTLR